MSIKEDVLNCTLCPLSSRCVSPIPGIGKKSAKWMFIYHVPINQITQKFVDKILQECNIDKDLIYSTSLLKCPVDTTTKAWKQYSQICESHLLKEIEKIQPSTIFLLGQKAIFPRLKSTLKTTENKLIQNSEVILPFSITHFIKYKLCYHPSYIMNGGTFEVNTFKTQLLQEL